MPAARFTLSPAFSTLGAPASPSLAWSAALLRARARARLATAVQPGDFIPWSRRPATEAPAASKQKQALRKRSAEPSQPRRVGFANGDAGAGRRAARDGPQPSARRGKRATFRAESRYAGQTERVKVTTGRPCVEVGWQKLPTRECRARAPTALKCCPSLRRWREARAVVEASSWQNRALDDSILDQLMTRSRRSSVKGGDASTRAGG